MWMNSEVFHQLTQRHFMFLKEWGMRVKGRTKEECVRFESYNTWLEVWFDKYDLFVRMGLKTDSYVISLWDVVETKSGKGNDVFYMASDEEKLIQGLQKIAYYVKHYCGEALVGDVEFYKSILRSREIREQKNAVMHENRNVEKRAKAAWDNGNYREVVMLYLSINEKLTPIQEKRLKLSQKRIAELSN